ncbi:hypothetical protein [Thiorhodospira sibirica]|uniref:hypothetical protein n=1 Tax=Thiorhodospira sibirica TaxID=154347 RepID=UPI00022C055B|nr:hypothetical protein [Thiorhodospira sibirica]
MAIYRLSLLVGVCLLGLVGLYGCNSSSNNPEPAQPIPDELRGLERPVHSLQFLGTYVDAVTAGESVSVHAQSFDGWTIQPISVVALAEDGYPVEPGTPIHFRLLDGSLRHYPANPPGEFLIQGRTADPVENDRLLYIPLGNLLARGVRLHDEVLLRPVGEAINAYHLGVRRIESLTIPGCTPDCLRTSADEPLLTREFDTGINVPYVISYGEHGSIMDTGYTDEFGQVHTWFAFPDSRSLQQVILVAHTADHQVSVVLDHPQVKFLPPPAQAEHRVLVSARELKANTTHEFQLCVLAAAGTFLPPELLIPPYPAFQPDIHYQIGLPGTAQVVMSGQTGFSSGVLATDGDACTTANIQVSAQLPGTEAINIDFFTHPGPPSRVRILGPDAAELLGRYRCAGDRCEVDLLARDRLDPLALDRVTGIGLADQRIALTAEGRTPFPVTYAHGDGSGRVGVTNAQGHLRATVNFANVAAGWHQVEFRLLQGGSTYTLHYYKHPEDDA